MPEPDSSAIVKRAKLAAGAIVGVLLLGAVIVLVLRGFQAAALEASTALHAKEYVTTISPGARGDKQPLTLPGTLLGVIESTVYARTNGYVLKWFKDIGSSVKKGDLMAEISAPEIDQELSQAIAARVQAAASADLAKSTADRWKSLRQKDAVTQQDLANVGRLRNLSGFNHVVAPFDGVVTRRNVDVGDLINAGNGGAGQALFTVAQFDPLRLYVYVPQAYANQVKIGDAVSVALADRADEQYQGSVARTARAIDTATRTMQVEVRVPNPNGTLIAGSYVQATLPINVDAQALVVPTNVLLFRPDGTRVALVDDAGRVHLALVKLGTDFGDRVQVLSGLKASDRVVLNPADSLADGDVVTPAAKEAKVQ
jgi:RND family efflux transporter MFP subunit